MAKRSQKHRSGTVEEGGRRVKMQQTEVSDSLLPSPEELQVFAELIPNGADRVMTMLEKEQSHRHVMNEKVVPAGMAQITRGQWMFFVLVILLIGVTTWCASEDKDHWWVWAILVGVSLLSAGLLRGKVRRQP